MTWDIAGVTVRFGATTALEDVAWSIRPGAVHAVIGGDGAGKSTLLRTLARLDIGQRGSFDLPPQEQIGFVPSAGGIFGDLTVGENMEFVADAYGLGDRQEQARDLLARSALSDRTDQLAGSMSGGERRKLAGAMVLLPTPALLVLDEITTGVDPVSRVELWRLIAGAAADGAAVVIATTYLDEAERAESVLLLHDGRVLAEGSPDSIIGGVPGSIADCVQPSNRERAWRRGAQWRQWTPDGTDDRTGMTLEDALIVAEIQQRDTARRTVRRTPA